MLRMIHLRSRKAILTSLLAVCLLGFCTRNIITWRFADMELTTSRSADGMVEVEVTVSKVTQKTTLGDMMTKPPNNISNMSFTEKTHDQTVEESTSFNTTTSGYLQKQHGEIADGGNSTKNMSTNTTTPIKISIANNSSNTVTQEVFSTTTTMTFNKSLVIHCKESPYVVCIPPNPQPKAGKVFKIVTLRRPTWFPKSELNATSCKSNQCVFEENKVTNDTDIVVIYGVGLRDNFRVAQRWPHQLYIIQLWEPPSETYSDYITKEQSPWNNQINMIMSYRLDSEFFCPYYRLRFEPKPLDQRPNYYDIAKTKTRTAVWMVSHCKTPSLREKYVKEMQKYIDVDIFGKCGTPCGHNDINCNDWTTKYKFYLAFENALCTDYVTEKFFKIFYPNTHVIPVVRGGADYDKHFPNFTYINSAHFKTPKDLALHLKHLAFDLETYSKYLEYKDMYTRILYNEGHRVPCQICTYLHTQTLPDPTQVYNLKERLADGQCHNPTDF